MPEEGRPRFEPPPWEREQFEALAKKREAEEAARKAEAEHWRRVAEERKKAAEAKGDEPEEDAEEKAKERALAAKAEAMLLDLKSEEGPSERREAWLLMVSVGSGALLFGLSLAGYALVQGARIGKAGLSGVPALVGWLGAGAIGLIAMSFIAGGVWMLLKGLRRQGVL